MDKSLLWLDENVDTVLTRLSTLSFVEVALFCLVTHLPFREVLDVGPYGRLGAFSANFGARASSRATEYRYDAP